MSSEYNIYLIKSVLDYHWGMDRHYIKQVYSTKSVSYDELQRVEKKRSPDGMGLIMLDEGGYYWYDFQDSSHTNVQMLVINMNFEISNNYSQLNKRDQNSYLGVKSDALHYVRIDLLERLIN